MKKTMKKVLAIVLAIFVVVSTIPMAFATTEVANGTAGDGVTWVLDSEGTLTVSGTGPIVVRWYAPPWEEYNESITSVVIEEGITEVPDTAFCYAENLVIVSVPSTTTEIGSIAFWNCTSLEEINVHDDNVNYKSIDGILFTEDETKLVTYPMNKSGTEYTIPASVTTIGEKAFFFNVALESVIIPDTVTSLGEYAFEYADIDSVILGIGITNIPRGCFESCYDIKSLIIPDSVTTIENYAFYVASGLETLFIGSGVESIGEWVVNATYDLTTIHYKGTQEEWDATSIAEDNAYLYEDELHFISEDDYRDDVTPTCVDGHTAGYYCDDCEAYLTGEAIPAIAEHTPGAEVEENVVAPDCTTAGSKDVVVYCTVCDSELSRETIEIEALGHTSGEEVEENVVSPDCTTAGSKDVVTYCTVCGEETSRETIEIEALGHSYEDGTCTDCGELEINYTFSILEPSRTEIRNKDGIKLHAKIDGTAPAGAYVKWTADNGNFDTEELDGNILKIIAKNKGYTTFTATLYDADGNALATDSVEMYSNSGFFAKIGGFFRSIFGTTKLYEN